MIASKRLALHALVLTVGILIATGALSLPPLNYAEGLQKSPDSQNFAVVFKLPKLLFGFLLIFVLPRLGRSALGGGSLPWRSVLFPTLLCTPVLLGPALAIGYVRPDFGIPPAALPWMLNNLVFVCFGDELFYRGYLQAGIQERLAPGSWAPWIANGLVAVIFGLTHFRAGVSLVVLSMLAALFYGWAYQRGGVRAAILTHFGVNAIHFFCFSYPTLLR